MSKQITEKDFRVTPDFQTLCQRIDIDGTNEFIEVAKVKQYHYKVKTNAKEKKVTFNRDKLIVFNEISLGSGKSILPIMNLIINNSNSMNILMMSREQITVARLVKRFKISQPTISKYFKKLQDAGLLKRYKKNYYLSPYAFYPNINELKLRVLQIWWDDDFKVSYEEIDKRKNLELERFLEDAKEFMGVPNKEFRKLKPVQQLESMIS